MTADKTMVFRGRVWVAGDNINTDLILPIQAYYLTIAEQPKWVFSANRPGWSDEVRKGDILIGGKECGAGAMPVPLLNILKAGGIYPLLEKEGKIAPLAS